MKIYTDYPKQKFVYRLRAYLWHQVQVPMEVIPNLRQHYEDEKTEGKDYIHLLVNKEVLHLCKWYTATSGREYEGAAYNPRSTWRKWCDKQVIPELLKYYPASIKNKQWLNREKQRLTHQMTILLNDAKRYRANAYNYLHLTHELEKLSSQLEQTIKELTIDVE